MLCPWSTLILHLHFSNCSHCTGRAHGIQQQQSMLLSLNSMVIHVPALESCLESLQAWFCANTNSMTLNADTSDAILFATSQRAQSLHNQVSVNISGITTRWWQLDIKRRWWRWWWWWSLQHCKILWKYLGVVLGWRGGLVVGHRTCDLVVAGSRPGRDAAA